MMVQCYIIVGNFVLRVMKFSSETTLLILCLQRKVSKVKKMIDKELFFSFDL